MQAKRWMTGFCAAVLFAIAAGASSAQMFKERVDLTGRTDVAENEIIMALTPLKTRGLKTRGLQSDLRIALTINFAFDSAQLLPEAVPNLRSLGRALKSPQLEPYRIRIEGHTDSVGSEQYNQRLSQRRAQTVKSYLVKHFEIGSERLEIAGRGEAEPIDDNDTAPGRQRNRRAEFVNLGK